MHHHTDWTGIVFGLVVIVVVFTTLTVWSYKRGTPGRIRFSWQKSARRDNDSDL